MFRNQAPLPEYPADEITRFLGNYQFHPNAYMRAEMLLGYIDEQNSAGHLKSWSVVVMSHANDANGTVALGMSSPVNLIQRTRLDMPNIPHANIKSLVSTVDRVADIGVTQSEVTNQFGAKFDDKTLAEYREDLLGDVGLYGLPHPQGLATTPDRS